MTDSVNESTIMIKPSVTVFILQEPVLSNGKVFNKKSGKKLNNLWI
jgi:hypothetical protein